MSTLPPRTVLQTLLLLVRDLDSSLHFYSQGLGLPVLSRSGNCAARLDIGNTVIMELRRATSEAHCTTGYSPFITFTVTQMDETLPKLLRCGAAMDGPIHYKPYGKIATLRTPDGHMIAMHEPVGEVAQDIAAAVAARHELDKPQSH